jgi:hypothetical protein
VRNRRGLDLGLSRPCVAAPTSIVAPVHGGCASRLVVLVLMARQLVRLVFVCCRRASPACSSQRYLVLAINPLVVLPGHTVVNLVSLILPLVYPVSLLIRGGDRYTLF